LLDPDNRVDLENQAIGVIMQQSYDKSAGSSLTSTCKTVLTKGICPPIGEL
jgi:hypothetical protein